MSDPNIYQGPGNGGTHHVFVNVAAEGVDNTGATDSAAAQAAIWALVAAKSGQTAWYPNGTYLFSTNEAPPPNNLQVRLCPGATINQQLAGGHSPPQTAWLYDVGVQRGTANGTIHTTPTYYTDNPTVSVNLATKPLVGDFLNFIGAGASFGGDSTYRVTAVAGAASPWTVTLERPIVFPFVAGDTVIEYVSVPQNISVDGEGALGSGTGDQQWEFGYGNNVHVARLNYNGSTGKTTVAVGGLDIGMISSFADDCECDASGIAVGYYQQSTERCVFRRLRVKGDATTSQGISLLDSYSCGVVDSWAYGCLSVGSSGILLGSLGGNFGGCINCYIAGGGSVGCYNGCAIRDGSTGSTVANASFVGNVNHGVYIGGSGTGRTFVANVVSTNNGATGFIVLSDADIKNVDFSHNAGGASNAAFRTDPLVGGGSYADLDGFLCDLSATDSGTAVLAISGTLRVKNGKITTAHTGGPVGIYCQSATRVEADGISFNATAGGGAAAFRADAGVLTVTNCVATGSGGGVIGIYANGGTIIVGPNVDLSGVSNPVLLSSGTILMYQGGALNVVQAAGSQTFNWTQAATIVTSGTSGTIVINMAIPNLSYLVDNTAASGAALMKASAGDGGISIASGKSAWVKVNAAGTAMIRVTPDA